MPITLNGDTGIQTPMYNGTITANAVTPSVNMKNRIINGGMDVWQMATSATTTGGYNSVDRWTQVSGNSITHTQSTDVPTGFRYSLQMAGVGSNINQRIESVNCNGLGGATVTISLWYKNSTGSDPLSLSLYYANSADNFGSVTQIGSNQTLSASPSSSWTYYTATFTNISANAVNGLSVYIFRGSSATSTGLLTGVQLEVGNTATFWDARSYGTELALCQRYFYQTNRYIGLTQSSDTLYGPAIAFPVTMRTTPTLNAGATFTARTGSNGTPLISSGVTGIVATNDAVAVYNSSSNWNTNTWVSFNGGFTAEL